MDWQEAQHWEKEWHGLCNNTFHEEKRQYIYARYMGLDEFATNWYGKRGWDFGKLNVVDIGGGPASLLLKSKAKSRTVVDPCDFPNWVIVRYEECGIQFDNEMAEMKWPHDNMFDLALIYNVLQHVESPFKTIKNIKLASKEIRIFDWLETPISEGHIHSLKADQLDEWFAGIGKVIEMKGEAGLVGRAYVGIFPC